MIRRISVGVLGAVCLIAACNQSTRSSSDDDDQSGSTVQNGAGGTTTNGAGGSSSTTNGAGGSPTCKMGGSACEAYYECCSGVCSNQVCTTCAGEGQSCANSECCGGFDCYGEPPTCQSCKIDGEGCALASECCSNVCDLGTCADNGCNVGSCPSCAQSSCALTACQTEAQNCNANPDCVALLNCATTCTDMACVQQCGLMHPNGISEATALQQCACAPDVCGSDCAGTLCF